MVILCVFAPKRIERVQICGLRRPPPFGSWACEAYVRRDAKRAAAGSRCDPEALFDLAKFQPPGSPPPPRRVAAGRGAGRARGKEKKVGGTCARRAQRAREARERPSGRKKKSQGTFYLMSLPGAFPLVLRRFVGDHFSDSRGN